MSHSLLMPPHGARETLSLLEIEISLETSMLVAPLIFSSLVFYILVMEANPLELKVINYPFELLLSASSSMQWCGLAVSVVCGGQSDLLCVGCGELRQVGCGESSSMQWCGLAVSVVCGGQSDLLCVGCGELRQVGCGEVWLLPRMARACRKPEPGHGSVMVLWLRRHGLRVAEDALVGSSQYTMRRFGVVSFLAPMMVVCGEVRAAGLRRSDDDDTCSPPRRRSSFDGIIACQQFHTKGKIREAEADCAQRVLVKHLMDFGIRSGKSLSLGMPKAPQGKIQGQPKA
ncbi:hypothetical protein TRIUR3_28860 [Triticum urartu]|uniref:Uncharacterized protein n=1 Tax=Triticum urartu TaxID=4572 RepID=M7ZYY7_TRIUA|nr:hypothetical protein TRIUR3_28860 [Triticum urartu]